MSNISIWWCNGQLSQLKWVCLRSSQKGIKIMYIKLNYLPSKLDLWIRLPQVPISIKLPNLVKITLNSLLKYKHHPQLLNPLNNAWKLSPQDLPINDLIQGIFRFYVLFIPFLTFFQCPPSPIPTSMTCLDCWDSMYMSSKANSFFFNHLRGQHLLFYFCSLLEIVLAKHNVEQPCQIESYNTSQYQL